MQRLYREGEQKRALLNVAIRRLAVAERRAKGWERERRVLNWERLFVRLTEARGQGKRWRFRVENVKRKAEEEGYDELVRWLRSEDLPDEGLVEAETAEFDGNGRDVDEGEEHDLRMDRRKAALMGGREKKKGNRRENFDNVSNLSLDMRSDFGSDEENKNKNANNDDVYKLKINKKFLINNI